MLLPSLKVLVVDDMPAVRMVLRNMLAGLGVSAVAESEDGDLAWLALQDALAERVPFDLVVCDWNMPRMSGADLLRAVRASSEFRKVAFLMVTAQGDLEHLSEAQQAQVDGYVVKPFTAEQLEGAIRQALGRGGRG